MLRYGLLTLQVALVLCALYLAYSTVSNLVFAGEIPEVHMAPPEPVPERDPSFERFQIIVARNLLDSQSFGAEAAPEVLEEQIEESKLQVKVLGTAATQPPEGSLAAVLDQTKNESLVVRPGDIVAGAQVIRVERTRVVVNNRGRLEALTLEEPETGAIIPTPSPAPAAGARAPEGSRRPGGLRSRVKALAAQAQQAQQGAPNPESGPGILTQARMLPSYDERGQLRGLRLTGIKAGSCLQTAGFMEGDIVRTVNGAAISTPAQGLKVLRDIGSEPRAVEVERDGAPQGLSYSCAVSQ